MLVRRYSLRTVKSYSYWIKSFILFHDKIHPTELGGAEMVSCMEANHCSGSRIVHSGNAIYAGFACGLWVFRCRHSVTGRRATLGYRGNRQTV